MRRKPNQDRSEITVAVIVEAAIQVLIEAGYTKATTNRIAARAGVSVGSIYQYFDSKDAIFELAFSRYIEAVVGTVAHAVPHRDQPLADLLRALVIAGLGVHPGGPGFLRRLQQSGSPTFRAHLDRAKTELATILGDVVRQSGSSAPEPLLTLRLRLALDATEGMFLHAGEDLDAEQFADEIVHMLAPYLGAGMPR